MISRIFGKLKAYANHIALFGSMATAAATVHFQDLNLKVKTYFCINAQQVTYLDTRAPSQSWGKCYYTLKLTRGEYAELKSKIHIDPRIYRNFTLQPRNSRTSFIIPLE